MQTQKQQGGSETSYTARLLASSWHQQHSVQYLPVLPVISAAKEPKVLKQITSAHPAAKANPPENMRVSPALTVALTSERKLAGETLIGFFVLCWGRFWRSLCPLCRHCGIRLELKLVLLWCSFYALCSRVSGSYCMHGRGRSGNTLAPLVNVDLRLVKARDDVSWGCIQPHCHKSRSCITKSSY